MNVNPLAYHEARRRLPLPFFPGKIPAGFPSPAADYLDKKLDLNELLVKRPAATFYCEFTGDSLIGEGIRHGDIGVVDRSLATSAKTGDIVIVVLDGAMTAKILDKENQCLRSANEKYPPIPIEEFSDLIIEGVVVHTIRSHRARSR